MASVTPIHDNQSLYAAVTATSEQLCSLGREAAGDHLRETLSFSTLPGELLGELRIVLQDLVKDDSLPAEVRESINSQIAAIHGALR